MSHEKALVLFLVSSALLQTSCNDCGGNNARGGCVERGETFAFHSVLRENHVKAFDLFQETCNFGNEKGCDDLLWMCLESKCAPEEAPKAAQIFQAACDGGRAKRCTGLGVMYARGLGVNEDDAKAAKLFQKACDGGNARGCGHLAASYASLSIGEVLVCGQHSVLMPLLIEPFEFREAFVSPHESSCAMAIIERVRHRQIPSGDCTACSFVLGARYGTGSGLQEDDAKAVQLYQKACDGGDGLGCLNLSNMYRNGLGGRKDAAKAALVATRGFALAKGPEPPY